MAGINHSVIPNLSIDSLDGSSASVPSLTVASTASLSVAGHAAITGNVSHTGIFTSTGTLNTAGNTTRHLSKSTTASVSSVVVRDGEFMITDVSVGANAAAVIAFRSGVTTYRWSSTTATMV